VVDPGRYHSFDRIAGIYDETRKSRQDVLERAVDVVVKKLGLRDGDRILDVGCGTGRVSFEFADRGYEVIGLDPSHKMLSEAAMKAGDHRGIVRLVQGDAQSLPFAKGVFDAALVVHVFHLMEGWRGAFLQAMESLGDRGSLVLWASDRGRIIQPVRDRYWEVAARHGYANLRLGARDFDEVVDLARESGFSVSRIDSADLSWEFESSAQSGIDLLRRKWVTDTWVVPDDHHARIIEELTEILSEELGDLTVPSRFTNTMPIYQIRRS